MKNWKYFCSSYGKLLTAYCFAVYYCASDSTCEPAGFLPERVAVSIIIGGYPKSWFYLSKLYCICMR